MTPRELINGRIFQLDEDLKAERAELEKCERWAALAREKIAKLEAERAAFVDARAALPKARAKKGRNDGR